jgi:UDP-glucose 4-epimerase
LGKIIVTGGAGFIGHHLVKRLLAEENQVIVIDNFSSGKYENLSPLKSKELMIYNEDITDDAISYIFKRHKADVIFHLAAKPGVAFSVKNPRVSNLINVQGTVNILNLSIQNEIEKFIFASSSSVYGGAGSLPADESATLAPKSPYALQKKVGEEYLYMFKDQIHTSSARFFNVFGKGQDPSGPYAAVIPSFFAAKDSGAIPKIYGDGNQTRDFCYIDNVIDGLMILKNSDETISGEVYNIGCGEQTSLLELGSMIGHDKFIFEDPRPGDVKRSCASIEKIKRYGYKPSVKVQEGLRLMRLGC